MPLRLAADSTTRYADGDDWIDLKNELTAREERERQAIESKMFRLKPSAIQKVVDHLQGEDGEKNLAKEATDSLEIDLNNTNKVMDDLALFDFLHYVKAWSLTENVSQFHFDRLSVDSATWVLGQIRAHRETTVPSPGDLKNSPSSSDSTSRGSSTKPPITENQTKSPANETPSSSGGESSETSKNAENITASPTPGA